MASCDRALGCADAPPPVEEPDADPPPTTTPPPPALPGTAPPSIEPPPGPTIDLGTAWVSIDPAAGHAQLTELRRRLAGNLGEDEHALQARMARLHLAIAADPSTPPAEATVQRERARATIEGLLAGQPADSDALLLSLAWLRGQDGDVKGMREVLLRLIREQPTSPFIPHAFMLIGDQLARDDPEAGKRLYERAATFPMPEVVVYAHYRHAWCMLHESERRPDQALELFVRAIDAALQVGTPVAEAPPGTLRIPIDALLLAARRELVVAYAEVGKPGKAWAFFGRVGQDPSHGDLRPEMMLRLAAAYRARGQRDEARLICAELADRAPAAAPSCPGR